MESTVKLIWARLTPQERAAAVEELHSQVPPEVFLAAIERGVTRVAEEQAKQPATEAAPRRRGRPRREAATAPTVSAGETLAGPNIPGSIGPEVRPPATAPSVSPFATN